MVSDEPSSRVPVGGIVGGLEKVVEGRPESASHYGNIFQSRKVSFLRTIQVLCPRACMRQPFWRTSMCRSTSKSFLNIKTKRKDTTVNNQMKGKPSNLYVALRQIEVSCGELSGEKPVSDLVPSECPPRGPWLPSSVLQHILFPLPDFLSTCSLFRVQCRFRLLLSTVSESPGRMTTITSVFLPRFGTTPFLPRDSFVSSSRWRGPQRQHYPGCPAPSAW